MVVSKTESIMDLDFITQRLMVPTRDSGKTVLVKVLVFLPIIVTIDTKACM